MPRPIHYRVHGEGFAVCGARAGIQSYREEEATCSECLRINADARAGAPNGVEGAAAVHMPTNFNVPPAQQLAECGWLPANGERLLRAKFAGEVTCKTCRARVAAAWRE